MERTKLRPSAV